VVILLLLLHSTTTALAVKPTMHRVFSAESYTRPAAAASHVTKTPVNPAAALALLLQRWGAGAAALQLVQQDRYTHNIL
jgi:hypothetical protein